MNARTLLQEYEPVEGGIYLRKDRKGVAIVSSDESRLGFLVINPKSRERFYGRGIVLEGDAIESGGRIGTYGLVGFGVPDLSEYRSNGSNRLLSLTPEHIRRFLENTNADPTDMPGYLDDLSNVPCEDYATDTVGNKVRNALATANLRYNPFKHQQRKELREQLKGKLPALVDDLYRVLQPLKDFSDDSFANRVKGYEELIGRPLDDLIGTSKEEIGCLLQKRALRKMKFTATRNVAEYTIENSIFGYSSDEGRVGTNIHQFKGHFKLNC